MWNLRALLFGHLTRNCRCSHCPSINSNYALHSGGFCASDPRPPPSFVPLHTHAALTHISRFSATSPPTPPPASHAVLSLPLCHWWTHLATETLWSHYEWTFRNMHIQKKAGEKYERCQKYFCRVHFHWQQSAGDNSKYDFVIGSNKRYFKVKCGSGTDHFK